MANELKVSSLDEELAEVEAQLAVLDKKTEEDNKKHKLEIGKLRLKYSSELGKEGKDFAIVDTVEGIVVVTRVPAIVSKRFRDSISGDKENSPQKSYEYTAPGVVHPDKETYKRWCDVADFIPVIVANALSTLHGIMDGEKRSKH